MRPRQTQSAAFGLAEAAVPLEPLELRPAAWHCRRRSLAVGAFHAATVAFVATLALVLWQADPADGGYPPAAWAIPVFLLVMAGAGWVGFRVTSRRRVWLGGGRIEVRLDGRTLATTTPSRLLASPRTLLVDGLAVPYRAQASGARPGRWIYDEHQIKRYVLAHLPPEQRIADRELRRARHQRAAR